MQRQCADMATECRAFKKKSFCFRFGFGHLDSLPNIDNPYFEQIVGQIYPTELQLNKIVKPNSWT